jgi:hypothetical protein
MKVVILCGGQGTRAYPHTQHTPKPLMPVAGLPVVEQVMRIYAAHGFHHFVLAVGHLKEALIEYFRLHPEWSVQCVDTGDVSDTGERIVRCLDNVGDRFHATYCDGLGDVDIRACPTFIVATAMELPSQPHHCARSTGFWYLTRTTGLLNSSRSPSSASTGSMQASSCLSGRSLQALPGGIWNATFCPK